MTKRPTAKDVADRAGVSRTQVSYVLNNNRIDHVSKERKERILKAAGELGYEPHSSAQTLRRGYSNEFSIFFPAPYPPRINDLIGTIHESGLKGNCVPIQYSFNSYKDNNRMREALSVLLNRHPYGIFCSLFDIGMEDIDLIISNGVQKILVMDIEDHSDFPTLYLPVEQVGYLAAKFLLDKGHKELGMLQPDDPVQERSFDFRLRGMERAIRENGTGKLRVIPWMKDAHRPDLDGARNFVSRFLSLDNRPTCLYAYGDDYAFTVLAVLTSENIKVPQDIAVIGTDNLQISTMSNPPLTTIQFDINKIGDRAVAMINSLITGEELEDKFKKPMSPIIVPRSSA